MATKQAPRTAKHRCRPPDVPPCRPRWSTQRNLRRKTYGPAVAKLTEEILGIKLMPWQRYVLDIALECDRHGKLIYREIRLIVPRQSGKSTLILALFIWRCLAFDDPQRVIFTMQTRNDARKKFLDDFKPIIEATPLRAKTKWRESNGQESLTFSNNSKVGLVASTEKSGHGDTLDMAFIDEFFAHDSRIEQACRPTMITRESPQLWLISTAGTNESAYFNGKRQHGRELVDAGKQSTIAYFEWSADDDDDPAEPDTWWRCMPALGITVPLSAIEAEVEGMELPEFKRAYLNITRDKKARKGWGVIGQTEWNSLHRKKSKLKKSEPWTLALDVTPDLDYASLGVAGKSRGRPMAHIEVVDHRPDTGWIVDRVVELFDRHNIREIVVDKRSTAAVFLEDLTDAGVAVKEISTIDTARYSGRILAEIRAGGLCHRQQPILDSAVEWALKRNVGDAWVWNRRGTSSDISPLVSVTLALGVHLGVNSTENDLPLFAY